MRYVSCRRAKQDGAGRSYSFNDAVLSGWAEDGGMILPESIPVVTSDVLCSWQALTYPELCHAILKMYMATDDLPGFRAIVDAAFQSFGLGEVVRLVPLTGSTSRQGGSTRLTLLELWHGPTLAFKDLGMQVLCGTIQHILEAADRRMTVLVGTSGDTGPSALAAIAAHKNMDCLVLYPKGRVSKTQEAQMLWAHQTFANAHVVAVEGTSDDLDVPCTTVFEDLKFKKEHSLGSVNSVNVLRLLVQVVHFFNGYFKATASDPCWQANGPSQKPPKVSFAIPTGAAGHVTAGLIAKLMGLPIDKLLAANNRNDVFDRMLREGVLSKRPEVFPTNAPAMDIQAPYNVERIFWLLSGGDGELVRQLLHDFNTTGHAVLPPDLLEALRRSGLVSACIEDGEAGVEGTIRSVQERDKYLLDPHTAVGVAAALKASESGVVQGEVVCMGCAHPAKFVETVSAALGIDQEEAWARLPDQQHRCVSAVMAATRGGFDSDMVPCFRHGEDWQRLLREQILAITASHSVGSATP